MTKKGKSEAHLLERSCPICGKNFIIAPEHVYHDGKRRVCGWSCQREAERRREAKRKPRGKATDPKRNEKIRLLAARGVKTAEIAAQFELTVSHVGRIIAGGKFVE